MKVVSTNIAHPTTISWKGKNELTGLYKKSVNQITLTKEGISNDTVIDKKHHGGNNKACYLYGYNHYNYWKNKYPNLDWEIGMFGENITIDVLDETSLFVGDVFNIGNAIIQITEPRKPCYKLGLRFKNKNIIKEFSQTTHSGTYAKVLKEGIVKPEDKLIFIKNENTKNKICITELI